MRDRNLSESEYLLRTLIIVQNDIDYLLVLSNERVHQNGNAEQIAPVAVSGATHLLDTIFLVIRDIICNYYFIILSLSFLFFSLLIFSSNESTIEFKRFLKHSVEQV